MKARSGQDTSGSISRLLPIDASEPFLRGRSRGQSLKQVDRKNSWRLSLLLRQFGFVEEKWQGQEQHHMPPPHKLGAAG